MNTVMENETKTIDSIEQLTIHSLGRSLEGLEMLRRDSIRCGDILLVNPVDVLDHLSDYARNLRDFYVFENDIGSFFMIDTERIRDNRGTLKSLEQRLQAAMQDMTERLASGDYTGLADLLRIDIPILLDRFQNLLPILSNHIENEYLLATP